MSNKLYQSITKLSCCCYHNCIYEEEKKRQALQKYKFACAFQYNKPGKTNNNESIQTDRIITLARCFVPRNFNG